MALPSFLDANNGIIVGGDGFILKTTDGGATWDQATSGTIEHLEDIFSPNGISWVVGDHGTILFSSDMIKS